MYHEVVLAGVAVSLLFSEFTGLSPAGLVVPGYIALSLQTPVRVVYTLLIALIAWGVARVLSRWMILYGRRRFAVLILLSFLINALIVRSGLLPYDPGMIGVLVPGIIANEVEALYTNGPAGGCGAVKRTRDIVSVASILVNRSDVHPEAEIFEV